MTAGRMENLSRSTRSCFATACCCMSGCYDGCAVKMASVCCKDSGSSWLDEIVAGIAERQNLACGTLTIHPDLTAGYCYVYLRRQACLVMGSWIGSRRRSCIGSRSFQRRTGLSCPLVSKAPWVPPPFTYRDIIRLLYNDKTLFSLAEA
jgi:hypothetical protein